MRRVSSLCLIRIDRNRYSVPAHWANGVVSVRLTADRVRLEGLDVACDLTLQTGIISPAIVLNEMRRLTEAARPKALTEAGASRPALTLEPAADCSRYDSLRSGTHAH